MKASSNLPSHRHSTSASLNGCKNGLPTMKLGMGSSRRNISTAIAHAADNPDTV
ncbi:hypothetical protein BT69DRAFT_1291014 [Atractiella rhizophila]|nr:hypothetical protein BT69DRAFT_1291014 [Atractiella rhizophila]